MPLEEFGNKTVSSDFLRVLLALKSNIMKDLNVADVCIVDQVKSDSVSCNVLGDDALIDCIALQSLSLHAGDIVLVVYCNQDFRTNYRRIINEQKMIKLSENTEYHSKAYGVIVAVVYTKEE